MFDFGLRELPNGRIMVRNLKTGENTILSPLELGQFFEDAFSGSIASFEDDLNRQQSLMDEIAKRGLK